MSYLMPKEFYEAFRNHFGFGQLTASASSDAYQMLKAAEWAWQASREYLVIELPYVHSCAPSEASSDQDYYLDEAKSDMHHQCRAAIHAAGVKYK